MRRLLILASVILLLVAIASVVAAQTEDEQLIADFMKARGFNFNDARATSITNIWLNDIDRLRPTLQAWVTRAAKTPPTPSPPTPTWTATPTTGARPTSTPPKVQRCGPPRVYPDGEERNTFFTHEEFYMEWFGGRPLNEARLHAIPIERAFISISGTMRQHEEFGAYYASGPLAFNTPTSFVLWCRFSVGNTIGSAYPITIRERLPTSTPTPDPRLFECSIVYPESADGRYALGTEMVFVVKGAIGEQGSLRAWPKGIGGRWVISKGGESDQIGSDERRLTLNTVQTTAIKCSNTRNGLEITIPVTVVDGTPAPATATRGPTAIPAPITPTPLPRACRVDAEGSSLGTYQLPAYQNVPIVLEGGLPGERVSLFIDFYKHRILYTRNTEPTQHIGQYLDQGIHQIECAWPVETPRGSGPRVVRSHSVILVGARPGEPTHTPPLGFSTPTPTRTRRP